MFYFVNFFVVVFLAVLLGSNNSNKSRKVYISLVLLFFMIETSIRGIYVGSDTYTYVEDFQMMVHSSWSDIGNTVMERYVLKTSDMDVGHYLLGKFFTMFSSSFQLYTFFLSFFYAVPLGLFLYRYTTDFFQLVFAFVFFVALLLIYPMCGARQMQAIGFGIIAVMLVDRGKYIKAIVMILLGSLIHSSLLVLLAYIFLNAFFSSKARFIHGISFIMVPFVLIFANEFVVSLAELSGVERYKMYGGDYGESGGALVFISLLLMLSLFCFIFLKKSYLEQVPRAKKLYMVLPFVNLLGPLIYLDGTLIRLSMYFHMYLMVLVPYAIDQSWPQKQMQNRRLFYTFAIVALVVVTLLGQHLNYYFYWEDTPSTWSF